MNVICTNPIHATGKQHIYTEMHPHLPDPWRAHDNHHTRRRLIAVLGSSTILLWDVLLLVLSVRVSLESPLRSHDVCYRKGSIVVALDSSSCYLGLFIFLGLLCIYGIEKIDILNIKVG